MKEHLAFFLPVIQLTIHIIGILISIGFFTLVERKILGIVHYRMGPNKSGLVGLIQPMSDAMKLITKDEAPVSWSNKLIFYAAPFFSFFLSLSIWVVTPSVYNIMSLEYSILIVMVMMGMGIYGVILSSWASNSKYALLGGMRAIAQSLSYEVILSFSFLMLMVLINSYSLEAAFSYKMINIFFMMPLIFVFFVLSMMVETQRVPFDLSEGESELVAGYNVEYGGGMYLMAYLTESIMLYFTSFMITFFFFYTDVIMVNFMIFSLIITALCAVRSLVPRFRYDILMMFCWKLLLPLEIIVFNVVIFLAKLM